MTDPVRHPDAGAPSPARPRCPRCGASLGRLDPDAGGWYCGCCGLVLPESASAR